MAGPQRVATEPRATTIAKQTKTKRKKARKVEPKPPSVHPRNKLNALKGNEWLYFTKSVLRTSYSRDLGHDLRREHGGHELPKYH